MRSRRFATTLLVGLILSTSTARAEDPGPGRFPARFVPAAFRVPPILPFQSGAAPASRDLRWHGTAVGAVGLGIAGGLTGAAYCGNSENGPRDCTATTVLWSAVGGVVGGFVGHFLGRLIPR